MKFAAFILCLSVVLMVFVGIVIYDDYARVPAHEPEYSSTSIDVPRKAPVTIVSAPVKNGKAWYTLEFRQSRFYVKGRWNCTQTTNYADGTPETYCDNFDNFENNYEQNNIRRARP